jgi:hypothetical protein
MSPAAPAGLAALAVAGVLAGCTGPPSSSPAPESSAAKAPVAYQSIKTLADHVSTSEAKAKTAHIRFATAGTHPAINGTGRLDVSTAHAPAVSMTARAGKKHLRIVLRKDTFYLESPHAGTGVKPWIKIEPRGHDPASKTFGALLSQLTRATDPSQVMHTLADTGRITGSRVQRYHGRQVRRYTVTVDPERLAKNALNGLKDKLPAAQRQQIGKKLQQVPGSLTAHLLLNRRELPVRLTASLPAAGGEQGRTQLTTTFSQWGKPVHVTAPPAKKVRTPLTAGH